MKERPILMSGPMVNAILAGRKTMTRRIIKGVNGLNESDMDWRDFPNPKNGLDEVFFRDGHAVFQYQAQVDDTADYRVRCPYGSVGTRLLIATEIPESPNDDYCAGSDGRIPRITLEITEVRVERLQAHAYSPDRFVNYVAEGYPYDTGSEVEVTDWFRELWDSINGKRPGCEWAASPWVWVISFQRLEAAQ